MSDLNCQSPACNQRSTLHITRVDGRSNVDLIHLCDAHGRLHFQRHRDRYYASSRSGLGESPALGYGVPFDLDFLYCDELQTPPHGRWYVGLIEIGGRRRVGFEVGSCEGSALDRELQRYPTPRPLTHHSMASIIVALGWRLQAVLIDEFVPSLQMYKAKLCIGQTDQKVFVDIRPSDATVLAVVCDAPILVTHEVLTALAENEHLSG